MKAEQLSFELMPPRATDRNRRARRGPPYSPCADCGMDTQPSKGPSEYYMVHDTVWRAAGLESGFLCIRCLEERLGRRLVFQDFTLCPINWDPVLASSNSARLRSRKFGK